MRRILLLTVILLTFGSSQSQYLAAFNDNQNQFWAFEAGMFNQLEDDEISNFQVGGNLIAYLDHSSDFKIYQYGIVQTLLEVAQVEYTATDYLLGYSLFDTLIVYDDEKITKLSSDCEEYIVRDSIIIWKTKKEKNLQVYYKGQVTTIAKELSYFEFNPKMAGDNIFAYANPSTNEFIAFYRGELIILDSHADKIKYQSGCDILAFIDLADQSFKIFNKGEIKELEIYPPESFQVGDEIVAYIDNQHDLKFFENGEVKYITSEPEFYEVKDHVMVFEEQGSFKTVCKGQIYIVEQYIPRPYYLDVNTIAYLEHNESIRVFQNCEHIVANKVDVVSFNMVRNVIVYAVNEDETKVFFNGTVYENR